MAIRGWEGLIDFQLSKHDCTLYSQNVGWSANHSWYEKSMHAAIDTQSKARI